MSNNAYIKTLTEMLAFDSATRCFTMNTNQLTEAKQKLRSDVIPGRECIFDSVVNEIDTLRNIIEELHAFSTIDAPNLATVKFAALDHFNSRIGAFYEKLAKSIASSVMDFELTVSGDDLVKHAAISGEALMRGAQGLLASIQNAKSELGAELSK